MHTTRFNKFQMTSSDFLNPSDPSYKKLKSPQKSKQQVFLRQQRPAAEHSSGTSTPIKQSKAVTVVAILVGIYMLLRNIVYILLCFINVLTTQLSKMTETSDTYSQRIRHRSIYRRPGAFVTYGSATTVKYQNQKAVVWGRIDSGSSLLFVPSSTSHCV